MLPSASAYYQDFRPARDIVFHNRFLYDEMRTCNNHIAGALNLLMFEMALTGEEHCDTLLIGKFDGHHGCFSQAER